MVILRTLTPEEEREILRRFRAATPEGPINAFGSVEERIARLRKELESPALSADERMEVERKMAACIAEKERGDAAKRSF
jgi:hypothetical protein